MTADPKRAGDQPDTRDPRALSIDFVSDIACPWCAVGLFSLRQALDELAGKLTAQIRFQPFELNPDMGPEGEDMVAHLQRKYGADAVRQAETRALIAERGRAVGFSFHPDGRSLAVNTFKAHQLLAWAETLEVGAQMALKVALLQAYHGQDQRIDHEGVLLQVVKTAGLDVESAHQVLAAETYSPAVRNAETHWQNMGIRSVPATVVDGRYLISGGHPPETFTSALLKLVGATEQNA